MISAGCVALFVIALSARLSGRRKKKPAPESQSSGPRDENNLFEQFKRLAAEQPNNPELWLKWGKELLTAANAAKHPNMRLHRYNEACSCFQSATDINPSFTAAWQTWGQTLYAIYRLQSCEGRLTVDNAHTKFQTAARLAPSDAALWQHWGEELYMTASQCLQPEHRLELQDLADAKFAKAIQINPELMLEWKKWRSDSGGSRFTSQALSSLSDQPEISAENAATAAPLEASAPAQQPEASIPWARGASTPQEPSAWLTQDASPASGGSSLTTPGKSPLTDPQNVQ